MSVVLTAESKSIKREDTAGWMIDYFQPYLIWKEYDNEGHRKSVEELNFEQAKAKLFELTSQLSLRKQTKTVQKSWLSKLIHHFRENNG